MRNNALLLKILVMLLLPTVAFAASAIELFQRSQTSAKQVSYRGVKVATLICSGAPTTALIKVLHRKPTKTRTEYFAPSMLAGVVIIEDGEAVWRYVPSQSVWRPSQCTSSADALSEEAMHNFDFRLVGKSTLAGRTVYELYATPKSRDEKPRRLWIDADHYLVIGTQVEDASGRVVNSSRFTKIEFNPDDIPAGAFRVSGKTEKTAAPPPKVSFKVLKPAYLPQGYRLIGVATVMVQGIVSSHLQYSNGASTISVFQRKSVQPPVGPKAGGTVLSIYSREREGMQFTFIGTVPRSELRKMADSVR